MKITQFVIFLSVVLSFYTLINAYLFYHGWQIFPAGSAGRQLFTIIYLLLAISYPLGRILERVWSIKVLNLFTILGSFWIGAMIYFVLFFLLTDLIQLIDRPLNFLPAILKPSHQLGRIYIAASIAGAVSLIVLGGYLNAQRPRLVQLNLTLHKKVPGLNELHIVAASDIHLGTLVGARQLQHLVKIANELQPDLVLFAGDLLDEDMHPEKCNSICNCLAELKPRFGVYTVPGNHEYYVGLDRSKEYLSQFGVIMLTDSVVNIADQFLLVGRHDADRSRFSGQKRQTLADLLKEKDVNLPTIVLDHQPVQLTESVTSGVDLQISGHTHHGQLWPFNYLTRKVYQISHGYQKINNTHFYVSCGYGTWGPPLRTNSRPEIVEIRLKLAD